MGKSLTEAARSVLMKEETENAATLKPNSKDADPTKTLGTADKIADAPVKVGDGENVGAKAATKGKDTTIKAEVPAETVKKQESISEDEDINEDEFEISEELASFIDNLVAEGLTEEEIEQAVSENFEFVTEEDEVNEEDVVSEDVVTYDMKEHVDALLQGEELSEEFKEKAQTIFEAAVTTRVQEEITRLEESYAKQLEENLESIVESLASDVDDYLNFVAEQWISENEIAIESSLKSELTEDFISGLRNLFNEHYIDIPDDKVSVVEEMGAKVQELEAKLNEEIDRNVTLFKALSESKKVEAINALTENLTDTQAEKIKTLAENVEFTTEKEFSSKINTLKESYFPTNIKSVSALDTIEAGDEGKTMIAEESDRMSKYARALGKSLPK